MPRKDIDYSNCIIYKIVCNDFSIKDLYVGHTTDLVKRRSHHKCLCNSPDNKEYNFKVYKTIKDNGGWDNWSVIVIEKYLTCNNVEEARTRERYWFEQLHADLNTITPNVSSEEIILKKRRYF